MHINSPFSKLQTEWQCAVYNTAQTKQVFIHTYILDTVCILHIARPSGPSRCPMCRSTSPSDPNTTIFPASSRGPLRSPNIAVLSGSKILSNRNILGGSCEGVGTGAHGYTRVATLAVFVACSFELLSKGRSVTEDGTFPVDYIDGHHEDEGDTEEDGRCVGEGVRANVWEKC